MKRAQHLQAIRANPEMEARRLEGLRRSWADPETKARRSAELTEAALSPQGRQAQKAGCKASWSDPESRARRLAALRAAAARPESRARKAASAAVHHEKRRKAKERRDFAKSIVLDAGLPLLKESVDFAVRLLESGAHPHVISISLKRAA